MDGFQAWLAQLDWEYLLIMVITAVSALLCITVHETCHGLAAYALGDPTAKQAGRLTLNPLKHLDLFGLVMLLTVRFGWAKPVPVDMRRFRRPRLGMAMVSLAGPVSNVVLAWICTMLYAVAVFYSNLTGSPVAYYLGLFFYYTITLSAGLAVFNLLPVPPLDGSKVLFSFLPPKWYLWLMRHERWGSLILMALLWGGVLDGPLTFLRSGLMDGLSAIGLWPYEALVSLYF